MGMKQAASGSISHKTGTVRQRISPRRGEG
jgi:hypothetical protein